MNPGLQEQLNDPLVFVQVALSLLQLWVLVAHSSMSAMKSTDCTQSYKSEKASIYNAKNCSEDNLISKKKKIDKRKSIRLSNVVS